MDILIDPDRPGDFLIRRLWTLGPISNQLKSKTRRKSNSLFCAAYLNGTYDKYPIKLHKKKPKPMQIQAFIIRNAKGEFLLEKNIEGRLLGSFWSFPIMETDFIGQQLSLFEKMIVFSRQSLKRLFLRKIMPSNQSGRTMILHL